MNIGLLASGGDGAGMNNCLYQIAKRLWDKHNLTFFRGGYQGIIDDEVFDINLDLLKQESCVGGVFIKTSRSKEFMTPKGFKRALYNLKKHKIDLLVIMGGNGSLKGAKELVKFGINVLFVPATVDNDLSESDYALGFDTAVYFAEQYVINVSMSMYSLNRICIYEVMGRHNPSIAERVSAGVGASYTYKDGSTKEEMLKAVKSAIKNGIECPIVILQENLVNLQELASFLETKLKKEVKTCVLGYFQRGGNPTKSEIEKSSEFAKCVAACIKRGEKNKLIVYRKELDVFEPEDI